MSRIERNRGARIVLLLCALLTAGSVSFGASVADAGPLEGPSGPVGEVVGAPVKEVTESVEEVTNTVAPPIQGVTETAPPPVVETIEAVVPPVKEAAETAVGTTKEATRAVTSATPTPKVPSVPPVHLPAVPAVVTGSRPSESERSVVAGATKRVTHGAEETLGDATGSGRSSAGGGSVGASAGDAGPASGSVTPSRAAPTTASGQVPGDGIPGGERFKAPSTDGSVRAPVPKWVAYVWPAIALTRPDLARFLRRWEEGGMRLLLATATDARPIGSQGVAGAHASHDAQTGASDPSSSPFSHIPRAIGGFTSQVPGEALAYLVIVAILVAAVFAAIKLEIARHGHGPR